ADALGDPDPRWIGRVSKSKQDIKYEFALMGNVAMWLANPTPARLTHLFHCRGYESGWSIQHSSTVATLMCHPDDTDQRLTLQDLREAARLHVELASLHLSQRLRSPA